jgi:RHH-type proline utilization regulon transcriptional repressor/proline dehydrogenase/delta 1-pyrroline-5-carboxylate dehydrogenase
VRNPEDFPGPTGESNRMHLGPRGLVLVLGPGPEAVEMQVEMARRHGNSVLVIAPHDPAQDVSSVNGTLPPELLGAVDGFDAVVSFATDPVLKAMRLALSRREGPLIPLISRPEEAMRLAVERHVCIDLTAAGGNAALIAAAGT